MNIEFDLEKNFDQYIINKLSKHNKTDYQVETIKKDGIIDIVMYPLDYFNFNHRNILFGIESKILNHFYFKEKELKIKDQLDFFIQSLKYSQRKFYNNRDVFVFAPNIFTNQYLYNDNYDKNYYSIKDEKSHKLMRSILSYFGLGSWEFANNELYLFFKSELIYDTKNGYTKLAYNKKDFFLDKKQFNKALK